MRLTIWQFVAIVVAIIVGYLIYDHWWVNQDQNTWIRKMNGMFTKPSAEEHAQ
jgi:hypothetical protein